MVKHQFKKLPELGDAVSPKMKNVAVFSDSIKKGLNMKQFSSHICGGCGGGGSLFKSLTWCEYGAT